MNVGVLVRRRPQHVRSSVWMFACLCLNLLLIACPHVAYSQASGQSEPGANTADERQETNNQDSEGQSASSEQNASGSAVTDADPAIALEHLKLLVKPLTQKELVIEAEAWQDVLKQKVQEITDLRINKDRSAEDSSTEPDANADENQSEQTGDALARLNEQRTEISDRLNAVLDELEAKGGDVETFRKYVQAQNGVGIAVDDVTTLWAVIRGWLVSPQGGVRWLWNILRFLLILVIFFFASRFVSSLAGHGASRVKGTSQLLRNFVRKFVRQVVMVVGGIVALSALEIDITPMLAAIGAAGFVVGFALQDTLGNFASGLLILAYRPFDVGDVVDAGGVSGVVDSVSLLSTHIRTFDNKLIIVPNNDIWNGTITNATASDRRRVDMVFGIGYEDDAGQAKKILEELVQHHELVLQDPAPVVQLNELGDSSVNFICRPWAKTEDYWTVYWDITRQVKEQFDKQGISIPFPQRDVHVYQASNQPA